MLISQDGTGQWVRKEILQLRCRWGDYILCCSNDVSCLVKLWVRSHLFHQMLPEAPIGYGLFCSIRLRIEYKSSAISPIFLDGCAGVLFEHHKGMKNMRSHFPKLYEARNIVATAQDIIAPSTPQFKKGAVFLYEPIDQYRPEILAYHDTVRRFKTRRKIL